MFNANMLIVKSSNIQEQKKNKTGLKKNDQSSERCCDVREIYSIENRNFMYIKLILKHFVNRKVVG